MKKNDVIFLEDIIEAVEKIEKFCRGFNSRKFYNNDLIQSAVIRQFEILGEAINHLSSEIKEKHSGINWARAVSFRNILIHGYKEIDYQIVWKTVKTDLPTLKSQVKQILTK
ncbi:hypothetical protein AUJ40_01030 [Candidatus Berkelbacteria bacterium CG1_02_42_45]|uniref:DUF86 domain-containing protein n=3 Tax=Candidatus Berkelbacteria TaxID=1618330 RepID=A0A2M7K289_9BACT|nr:MAG: hypothetical protein AUJ40_01030 [Candidatus Berkelbacteria bacterium CG1_02_42_45]PIR27318.1 MAG: hypothetical protein COV40_01565 [Candidatus Berkelbacteria bacterium CG11_big_fil_rev_8_21_14_0_20_42_15]PIX30357.1 MAG: hypothetical protein COZ63_00305 [Candidatus Berkelbacteria bacterium CG_4_8_14_3_um_filter_42_13]